MGFNDTQVGHFISQFHVLFLSVALGSLATQPTTYLLLGKSPILSIEDNVDRILIFSGIDFMINLHSCVTVYKKKNEGALDEAGEELMVNGQNKNKTFHGSAGSGPQ